MAISDSEEKKQRDNCFSEGRLAAAAAAAKFAGSSDRPASDGNMDYGWLEGGKHDPIATDTNLAEIDFEDFRNEDLAYAFSCGVSQRFRSSKIPCVCKAHPFRTHSCQAYDTSE